MVLAIRRPRYTLSCGCEDITSWPKRSSLGGEGVNLHAAFMAAALPRDRAAAPTRDPAAAAGVLARALAALKEVAAAVAGRAARDVLVGARPRRAGAAAAALPGHATPAACH